MQGSLQGAVSARIFYLITQSFIFSIHSVHQLLTCRRDAVGDPTHVEYVRPSRSVYVKALTSRITRQTLKSIIPQPMSLALSSRIKLLAVLALASLPQAVEAQYGYPYGYRRRRTGWRNIYLVAILIRESAFLCRVWVWWLIRLGA